MSFAKPPILKILIVLKAFQSVFFCIGIISFARTLEFNSKMEAHRNHVNLRSNKKLKSIKFSRFDLHKW